MKFWSSIFCSGLGVFLISCSTAATGIPASKPTTLAEREATEFRELMIQDSLTLKERAAEALNILLNNEDNGRVSVSIKNQSSCNIIVRFSGKENHSLPVRKMGNNHIVLEKGNYFINANLCSSRWTATKNFWDSVTITLSERQ